MRQSTAVRRQVRVMNIACKGETSGQGLEPIGWMASNQRNKWVKGGGDLLDGCRPKTRRKVKTAAIEREGPGSQTKGKWGSCKNVNQVLQW